MTSSEELIAFSSILLFGPPGSGKGTLSKEIASCANAVHVSSGDIFRALSPSSATGKLFHSYASKGSLVPDDVTIAIWREYMDNLITTLRYRPKEQLLILDGIPRTMAQAQLLNAYLAIESILVLEITNTETLIQRIKKRAVIEGREDDIQEAVLYKRMEVYKQETFKLLDNYPKNKIFTINADQSPPRVLRDALIALTPIL